MSLLNSELESLLCSPSRLRTLDDGHLVAALRSGCNDALAVLFERHSPAVLAHSAQRAQSLHSGTPCSVGCPIENHCSTFTS